MKVYINRIPSDKELELSDFVGLHLLSGVDSINDKVKQWGDYYEDVTVMNFVIDGSTYCVVEDPGDGYRSRMEEVKRTDHIVKNRFEPQLVFGIMRGNRRYTENEVIDFYDHATGKIVLSAGTENTNDYYPWFVAEFTPENMAINRKGESDDKSYTD